MSGVCDKQKRSSWIVFSSNRFGEQRQARSEQGSITSCLFADELIPGIEIKELLSAIKFSDCRGHVVELWMPKFKIEYKFDKVEKDLEKLGVRRAFSPLLAEFENLPLKVSLL